MKSDPLMIAIRAFTNAIVEIVVLEDVSNEDKVKTIGLAENYLHQIVSNKFVKKSRVPVPSEN